MRRLKTVLALTALLCFSMPGRAVPEQPVPYRHINDLSGCTLPAARADSLEAVLCAFDDTTGNQIYAVVTLDLEDMAIEEYANRLFNSWGIGSKENNNGVLILIKAKKDSGDRGGVRIEVGDGLAGVINDSRAGRIIDKYMMDYLAAGDMFGAINSACSVIMPLAAGEFGGDGSLFDKKDGKQSGGFAAGVVIFVLVLLVFVMATRKNKGKGPGANSGSGGGPVIHHVPRGGGFSGGGFSGGGFSGGFGGGGGGFSSGGGASRGF